jgi:uncharacterized protein (TIGR03067 family)
MAMRRRIQIVFLLLTLPSLSAHAASEAIEEGRGQICGVWIGFAVEGKGESPDHGPVKVELTITPEVIKGKELQGENVIDHGEGSYELDLAKAPPVLDATKNGGRRETWFGIYSLEGDTLKWCVGRRGRPNEFETKKGAFLLILKRQKL